MRDVGTFSDRNKAFNEKFSREIIIAKCFEKILCPMIFDVGSHHGESLGFFKEIAPNAQIHCFEPDPESYYILQKNFPDHENVHNYAISDKIGEESFYRNPLSHTNSLNKVNLKSKDSIKIKQEKFSESSEFLDAVNQKVVVPCTTLNFFVQNYEIESIDLLKVDVQGAEAKVLNGAKNILNMVEAVIIEIALFDFYEISNNFLDIENILIPAGFDLFSILDISQNPMNGRTDWVELLYRKDEK